MLDQQVTLTTSTLLNLIGRSGAEPHTVLANVPMWRSEEARHTEHDRANKELGQLGLIGPRGIAPQLRAMLDTMTRPTLEYYAWIQGEVDGQTVGCTLLAVSGDRAAFILARDTDLEGVTFLSARHEELLNTFIAQLPAQPPGKGQAIELPKSALTGGPKPDLGTAGVMRSTTQDTNDQTAAELHRVLNLRRTGGGNLYVATRNYAGSRNRCEKPVNYIDTVEGRWLAEEQPGNPDPFIALTPATPQLLTDRIRTAQGQLST